MSIIAFILTIGILVTVHEFGHFLVARWCGVRVLKFSVGFGKPLWSYVSPNTQTEWIIARIPLGGYVKMLDERELAEDNDLTKHFNETELAAAFNRQSVWRRMAIVFAGPLANLLFAICIYWGLLYAGTTGLKPVLGQIEVGSLAQKSGMRTGDVIVAIDGKPIQTWYEAQWMLMEHWADKNTVRIATQTPTSGTKAGRHSAQRQVYQFDFNKIAWNEHADALSVLGLNVFKPQLKPLIDKVLSDSPAHQAGLQKGDLILSVNQKTVQDWQDFVLFVQSHPEQALAIEIERAQRTIVLSITPSLQKVQGKARGQVGATVSLNQSAYASYLIKVPHSLAEAAILAVQKTLEIMSFSFKMLAKIVAGDISYQAISGPVSIAQAAGDSADLGLKPFFNFLALISISIAVMNLLPIPVLDGGHLLYYIAEIIKGSPLPEVAIYHGQKVGVLVLGLLMLMALINDISRLMIS